MLFSDYFLKFKLFEDLKNLNYLQKQNVNAEIFFNDA